MVNQTATRISPWLTLIIGIVVGIMLSAAFIFLRGASTEEGGAPKATHETQGLLLSVSKPADGDFVTSSKLEFTGTTGEDAIIAITGGKDDVIVETSRGEFSTSVRLIEEINELIVYAFDSSNGGSSQESFSIMFLSGKTALEKVLVAEANTSTGDKTQESIENLKERLSTKSSELKQPLSFKKSHIYGAITSINKPVFTVETNSNGIKTVFTDELTNFNSLDSKSKSIIAFEDLKVGSNVAIAGIGSDDTFGTAKYILVNKKPIVKRYAIAGEVKKISGDNFTLSYLSQDDLSQTVKIGKTAKISVKGKEASSLSDIKTNDFLVATGTVGKTGVLEAKKVFVIPAKSTEGKKETIPSAKP